MAGFNPYLQKSSTTLSTTPYQVTFLPANVTVKVTPEDLEHNPVGEKGSLLSIAEANGIMIDHSCGGVCACSTCHVFVKQGMDSCNAPTEDEEDMLDMAPGLRRDSRLACQCIPDGSQDIVIEIPGWNRNLVSETPH
ncbi:MAG: 2Fe-2S iron-sulfur cluster binding domain-containing protein [SAR324 cluster bacterium]|nr:2Fe-2S iron-sulfur cluster binding domain-containing protein [SAR324 cluster bacterium]